MHCTVLYCTNNHHHLVSADHWAHQQPHLPPVYVFLWTACPHAGSMQHQDPRSVSQPSLRNLCLRPSTPAHTSKSIPGIPNFGLQRPQPLILHLSSLFFPHPSTLVSNQPSWSRPASRSGTNQQVGDLQPTLIQGPLAEESVSIINRRGKGQNFKPIFRSSYDLIFTIIFVSTIHIPILRPTCSSCVLHVINLLSSSKCIPCSLSH